jgi:hypothetical protein
MGRSYNTDRSRPLAIVRSALGCEFALHVPQQYPSYMTTCQVDYYTRAEV